MTKDTKKARAGSTKTVTKAKAIPTGDQAAPPEGPHPPTAKSASKIDQLVALLSRSNGATLDELVAATGWLPHTTRAALTGLKKKGRVIGSEKIDGIRRYRLGE